MYAGGEQKRLTSARRWSPLEQLKPDDDDDDDSASARGRTARDNGVN